MFFFWFVYFSLSLKHKFRILDMHLDLALPSKRLLLNVPREENSIRFCWKKFGRTKSNFLAFMKHFLKIFDNSAKLFITETKQYIQWILRQKRLLKIRYFANLEWFFLDYSILGYFFHYRGLSIILDIMETQKKMSYFY